MKKRIYFADLTHKPQGIQSPFVPYGNSLVLAYAQKMLGDYFDFRLFKYPDILLNELIANPPEILCMSNYAWNSELSATIATVAVSYNPRLIVIFGGPNYPLSNEDRSSFLKQHAAIDFYIELEGEHGLVGLLKAIIEHDYKIDHVKRRAEKLVNCSCLVDGELVQGPVERIRDLNDIPSPYLMGILDEFLDQGLIPIIETARGCPFSCIYCADGIKNKNHVFRYDHQKTRDELYYIAQHVNDVDEVTISDLNFGMFKEDLITAECIADIRRTLRWPVTVKASAGKNNDRNIMKVASILGDSWSVGLSIQSSDKEVLRNIKRSNISSECQDKIIEHCNAPDCDISCYTDVILGLPGDTKEKHFQSLKYAVDKKINSIRMYQAMILSGAELSIPDIKERFGLVTKYRVMPGCAGIYQAGARRLSIIEVEEIIVASDYMSFDDYVECRVMNLIIESFVNYGLFDELFTQLWINDESLFEFLVYLNQSDELKRGSLKKIFESYIEATSVDLFETRESTVRSVMDGDVIQKYMKGELGMNEILYHMAWLYSELETLTEIILTAFKRYLTQKGLIAKVDSQYLDQLGQLIIARKKDFHNYNYVGHETFGYDFKKIHALGYHVTREQLRGLEKKSSYRFYHDDDQKSHIQNGMNIYSSTALGMARLIHRSDMKQMYRQFCDAPVLIKS